MGTPMTYISGNTGAYQSGTFNKGTIALNLNPSSLASGNNWYNGVDVTATQYLIYSDTYSTGIATQANSRPTAWTTPDLSDTSLLNLINTLPDRIGLTPFTSLPLALQWLNATNEYFLIKTNFENIVTSGLVLNLDAGWYNSYSGTTTWFDIKGGYNGTLTNGPTFSGNSQGVIVFDGVDDYVSISNTSLLTFGTNPFSIGFWIYPTHTTLTSYRTILSNYNDYNSDYTSYFYLGITSVPSNNTISFLNSSGNFITGNGFVLKTNVWTHVMFTRNGNVINSYENGILQSSVSESNNFSGTRSTKIGGGVSGVSTLQGNFSNLKIYNQSLSPEQVLQNYNAQKSRFGFYDIVQSGNTLNLSASNYLSYPRSGTTWFDMTSTGNNGTFVNGPTFNTGATPSIQFDGADDYINIPNGFTKTLKGKQYWTASIWVKVTSWGSGNDSFPVLVSIGANQGQYGELYLEIGNANQYYMAYAGDFAQGSFTTNLNQIYNLVYMKDGNSFKVYSNGVLIDTQTGKNNVSSVDGDLWIGRFKTGDYELNGNIYNFSMYDRALSASEIVQNFESQRNIYGATGYTTSGLTLNLDAGNYASYPTTGTKWVDISGNYNNGDLINGPTWSSASGGTITFDGTDDRGVINNYYPVFTGDFAINLWVNFSTYLQYQNVISSANDGNAVLGFWLEFGSARGFTLYSTGTNLIVEDNLVSLTSLSTNTWHNVCVTRVGTGTNNVKLYVDNVLCGQNTSNLTVGSDSQNLEIARYSKNAGTSFLFNGKIAVIQTYNNVGFSASQVLQNYNALKGRFGL